MREDLPFAYMGVDPGTAKCGIAALDEKGNAIYMRTVSLSLLTGETTRLLGAYRISDIAVGNRTGAGAVVKEIKQAFPGINVSMMEEAGSTSEGVMFLIKSKHPMLRWVFYLGLAAGLISADSWAAYVIAKRAFF